MAKKLKSLIIFICLITSFLVVGHFAFAQGTNIIWGNQEGNISNIIGLGAQDPRLIIANFIRVALGFLGVIALVLVIYSGWIWMTAGGNMEKIDKAKKILISAVIGLIIILSSFLIVTFILNKLYTATGGGGGGPCVNGTTRNCGCGGIQTCIAGSWGSCVGSTCGTNTFFVTSTGPVDLSTNVILNAKIRYTFNDYVDSTTVTSATFIVTDSSGAVAGNITVKGKRITFTPTGPCPLGNPCGLTNGCFQPSETINIQAVNGQIDSINGNALDCSIFPQLCNISFDTGNVVDCANPNVTLDFNQICVAPNNPIYANSSDDNGIDNIEFFVDGASIPSQPPGQNPVVNPLQNTPFNTRPLGLPFAFIWDGSGYTPGTSINLKATAYDIDNNNASDSKSVALRAAHCCDGIPYNGGETGLDCGGPDCAACAGGACAIDLDMAPACTPPGPDPNCVDSNCASGFCNCGTYTAAYCASKGYTGGGADCCICENAPIIDWVTPVGGFCDGPTPAFNTPCTKANEAVDCAAFLGTCNNSTSNGATGNLVTIGGRFFSTFIAGTSQVDFTDSNGNTITASLADTVNPACTNSWQNTQIIVVLPVGLAQGPGTVVTVTAGNGFSDNTQSANGRGPDFDFVVNTIARPGLCDLSPDTDGDGIADGIMNDTMTYQGIRLTNSQAYFGNMSNNVIANNSNFPGNTTGMADVSNIQTGKTTSFVIDTNSDVGSNYLRFNKNPEAPIGPQITSFSPSQGPQGQYVTIYGSGFGATKGTSIVNFGIAGVEADYTFPAVCANSVWSDKQVIVKVPGMVNGFYSIEMVIAGWPAIDTGVNTFQVDSTLPLAPSLCKIQPVMGPNLTPVTLWGEYFGPQVTGSVSFQLNQPGPVTLWNAPPPPAVNQIDTSVPLAAVSGPVQVVQAGLAGNGINFTVGYCTKDADCGGITCCPAGSFKEGQCADDNIANGGNGDGSTDIKDCYYNGGSSVFEWDFSTGFTSPPLTCAGYSMNQCTTNLFCPNSPGQCSPYAGGAVINMGSCDQAKCDSVCSSKPANTCAYDIGLNRCVDPGQACDLNSTTLDILGNTITKYCDIYDDGTNTYKVWHINTSASCPPGWTKISGNRCVDSVVADTCNLCSSGFICFDDAGAGKCVIDKNICPGGSTCNAVTDQCETTDNAICECCCDINAPVGQDCCAPLVCAGQCGSDKNIPTNTYGYCSGCYIETDGIPGPTPGDQATSDAACNCTGTTGKVCDMNVDVDIPPDGIPDGICIDAAITGAKCYDVATAATCNPADPPCALATDFCDPNSGCTCQPILIGTPCFDASSAICTDNTLPVCPPGLFCDPNAAIPCTCQLAGLPTGASCEDATVSPPVCDPNACQLGFECSSNALPLAVGNCGYCCCDMANDQCGLINPVLKCNYVSSGVCADLTPSIPPVAGPPPNDFGLCCGCTNDAQCGNPQTTACSIDSCCRPRPVITSTSPVDGAVDVCRNTLISVDFDQKMDTSSFTGNVIVAGDYGTNLCPAGTQFLAVNKQKEKGIIARMFSRILQAFKKLLEPIFPRARALTQNFCAISGRVSGYHNSNNTTTLEFSPSDLLDTSVTYYVIIKGDSDLGDNIDEGVLNYWGISMADMGAAWPDLDGNGTPGQISDRTFNGKEYYGYVFSFTTMSALAPNNGVCVIDHVEITPNSYLFQTTSDDLNEVDDDINDSSFDTVSDSDKVFEARAISSDGYVLTPITGVYEWLWSWNIANTSIVDYDPNNPYLSILPVDNKQLIEAISGVTDSKTTITATAQEGLGGTNNSYSADANVWVFVCENPWPPVDPVTGFWAPWIDNQINCLPATGQCFDTNYELYYCRDAGGVGTADDLPALLSSNTVIRGSSTVSDLLKEFYFLREQAPSTTSGFGLVLSDLSTSTVGVVQATWIPLAGVDGYKLYWGTASGNYNNYIDVGNVLTYDVYGLKTGQTYYFSMTAYYNTGAESNYSNEVRIVPQDLTPPAAPVVLTADNITCDGDVSISWAANNDDAVGYRVYYGATSGQYGGSQDVGNVTSAIIKGLAISQYYYIAVTAYDAANNESAYSVELSVYILDCSGLVAHWPFDIENSGVTPDVVGGNDGTLKGAGVFLNSSGYLGGAMDFDGISGYVDVGNGAMLEGYGSMTLEAWAYADDYSGTLAFVYGSNAAASNDWALQSASNKLRFSVEGGGGVFVDSINNIPTKSWVHLVGTYNGSTLKVYINGIEDNSVAAPAVSITDAGNDKNIGRWAGGSQYFDGLIDEVKIYNRSLSAQEVKALYDQALQAAFNFALVAHWPFESVAGGNTPDVVGINDGTLKGGVSQVNGVSGKALYFDGFNDYISLNNTIAYTDSEDWTILYWANLVQGDWNKVLGSPYNYDMIFPHSSTDIYFGYDLNVYNSINLNESFVGDWHFYAYSSDSTDIDVYFDDKYKGVITPPSQDTGLSIYRIGADNAYYVNGMIDEVMIFDRALSGSEVDVLFKSYP